MSNKQDDWPENWLDEAAEIMGITPGELRESIAAFGVVEISYPDPDGTTKRFRYADIATHSSATDDAEQD